MIIILPFHLSPLIYTRVLCYSPQVPQPYPSISPHTFYWIEIGDSEDQFQPTLSVGQTSITNLAAEFRAYITIPLLAIQKYRQLLALSTQIQSLLRSMQNLSVADSWLLRVRQVKAGVRLMYRPSGVRKDQVQSAFCLAVKSWEGVGLSDFFRERQQGLSAVRQNLVLCCLKETPFRTLQLSVQPPPAVLRAVKAVVAARQAAQPGLVGGGGVGYILRAAEGAAEFGLILSPGRTSAGISVRGGAEVGVVGVGLGTGLMGGGAVGGGVTPEMPVGVSLVDAAVGAGGMSMGIGITSAS